MPSEIATVDEKLATIVLRVIGGPSSGKEFPLTESAVTIGRTGDATITVPDILISRQHARVFRENGKWLVEDLKSTNGTWIQGQRVTEPTDLPMRTAVRIGDTLFELFSPQDPEKLDTSFISYRVSPITADSLTGNEAEPAAEAVQREQRKLAAFYKLQSLLSANFDEHEQFKSILEIVTDVIPADRAYLLIYVTEQNHLVPVAERDLKGAVEVVSDTFLSKSIVRYVQQKNEAVLSEDVLNDERFHSESLCGFNINSIMCAPIHGNQQFCGLIYMLATQVSRRFTEDDLKLLAALAHSAGMAIENGRLFESNLKAERMAAIGMTAASLSHYVKNILGGLEGSVSLLRLGLDSSDDSMMNEAWDILDKNQKRLSSLMLDLLSLAKEDRLDIGMYSLTDLVIEAVELVRTSHRCDRVAIETADDLASDPVLAEVDSRGMHRVLLNLLNNAVDAVAETLRKDGVVKVDMRVNPDHDFVTITISDNGAGIPPEKLDKVFDMFYTTKGDRGTGLGLAVSRRIIEGHRGIITVGSEIGVGSEFKLRLPTRHHDTTTSIIDLKELI